MDTTFARFESARLLSLGYLARTKEGVNHLRISKIFRMLSETWCRWPDSLKCYMAMEEAFSSCGEAEWRTYSAHFLLISWLIRITVTFNTHAGSQMSTPLIHCRTHDVVIPVAPLLYQSLHRVVDVIYAHVVIGNVGDGNFRPPFYPRDAMLARVIEIATCPSVCPSVCLSVRPSRAGIVSKRRKLASWFLHHLVAPRL